MNDVKDVQFNMKKFILQNRKLNKPKGKKACLPVIHEKTPITLQ